MRSFISREVKNFFFFPENLKEAQSKLQGFFIGKEGTNESKEVEKSTNQLFSSNSLTFMLSV